MPEPRLPGGVAVSVKDQSAHDTFNQPANLLERTPAIPLFPGATMGPSGLKMEGPRQTGFRGTGAATDAIRYSTPAAIVPFPEQTSNTPQGYGSPGTPNRATMVDPNLPPSEMLYLVKQLATDNNKMRRELKKLKAMKNPNPIKASAEQGEQEEEEQGEQEEENVKVHNSRLVKKISHGRIACFTAHPNISHDEYIIRKYNNEIGKFAHGGNGGPTSKGGMNKHLPSGGTPPNQKGDATGTKSPHVDIDPDDIAGQEEEISVRVSHKPRGPREGTDQRPGFNSSGYIDPDNAGGGLAQIDSKTAGMQVGTITRREQVVRTVPSGKDDDDDKAEEGTDLSQVPTGRGVKIASEQGEQEEEQGEQEEEARKATGKLERLYPGYKVILQKEQEEQGEEEQGEEQGEQEEETNPILKAAGIKMSAIDQSLRNVGIGPVRATEQMPLIEARANSLPSEALKTLARNARILQILQGGKLPTKESGSFRVVGSRRIMETPGYSGLPQNAPRARQPRNPTTVAFETLRKLEKDHSLTAQERARIAFLASYPGIIEANRRNPLAGPYA